jgi:hypothetical protein
MKRSDNVLEGKNHNIDYLFSFSTSKFQSFFVSRMNAKKSVVEKLQRQFKEKL